jgi:DNA modification methylase
MAGNPETSGNGFAVSRDLAPRLVRIDALTPLGRGTRKHPPAQIRKLQASLEQFGFVIPIVIDAGCRVVAGWALAQAARKMGLQEIPAIAIADLDDVKLRLLRLALNRLGEDSTWDVDALRMEFADILEIDNAVEFSLSGFEMGEIDAAFSQVGPDEEDDFPSPSPNRLQVARPGDVWRMGDHRILCGDALAQESYERLLKGEKAQMIFCDPPFNIRIEGNVSGLGAVKHEDFAMGCGEMTASEFAAFLRTALGHAAAHSIDGSIHYVCMHWSKMAELLAATSGLYSEMKNVCAWVKPNGGMGSLYRSRHEFVFVLKRGNAPHINNVELGRFGRNRSNVWEYAGQNVLNGTAKSKLALHPTPKPVALVADAIRDCSDRNGMILDPFGGVGATLIAAQKTGRRARLIELNPGYVDAAIRRWSNLTGEIPVNADTGAAYSLASEPVDSQAPSANAVEAGRGANP